MYRLRLWSTRHARGLESLYQGFERALVALDPLWRRIGYERLERPVAAVERRVKGLLFDCRMCGQCALSDTGMACPMNCPKTLRNGPCGGVRADGTCEVVPAMRCVWVEAWEGSRRMRRGKAAIRQLLPAIDRRLEGRSAWLGTARAKAGAARRAAP
ncbi:MAG TPA: methylenetetrahydrofolate reductase C-terminal domain-containing protein [Stellaceae bacterium]|nr:methylenetetrahydrofolate reductase C-terminal domain-containing protein [Stellaceae bacterium]